MDPKTHKIIHSRDVIFLEDSKNSEEKANIGLKDTSKRRISEGKR